MQVNLELLTVEQYNELLKELGDIKDAISQIPNNSEKDVYTEKEVRSLLDVSAKTLQNYRNSGKIGFVKIKDARKILYKKEHISEFLNKNEFKAFK
ncbi:MAG: helix-turn-helix domain-containing protein [Bacteroidetes bacterium]|nr:helix-turn-helix domain-containing protein [Bacteroidota bacterium]